MKLNHIFIELNQLTAYLYLKWNIHADCKVNYPDKLKNLSGEFSTAHVEGSLAVWQKVNP